MKGRMSRGVVMLAALSACGGKGGDASEPTATTSCEAAAGPIARATIAEMSTLADASAAHVASLTTQMTVNLTKACTDTAWTEEQRRCFAASATQADTRACTGSFVAPQTEVYADAMMQALEAADAADATSPSETVPTDAAPAGDGE